MKRFFTAAASVALLLAACRTGQTQSQPQVIVVPPDELSRQPSVGSATTPSPETSPANTTPIASPAPAASAPAARPAAAPQYSYNSCNVDGPYIAMTFDDGPSAELTPKLLDMLKARGIKATFFMVGQNVAEYPDIVKRMVAEGHEVANHSWSHVSLTQVGADGLRHQMKDTNDAIEKACGVRPTIMRPPYGATNAAVTRKINEEYGMKVIIWSVDPLDWKYRNSGRVTSQILEGAAPGAIILAHDIHKTTVAAMPATFDALLAKGYKFVTVSELIAMDRPLPPKPPKPAEPQATSKKTGTSKTESAPKAENTPQAAEMAPLTETGPAPTPTP